MADEASVMILCDDIATSPGGETVSVSGSSLAGIETESEENNQHFSVSCYNSSVSSDIKVDPLKLEPIDFLCETEHCEEDTKAALETPGDIPDTELGGCYLDIDIKEELYSEENAENSRNRGPLYLHGQPLDMFAPNRLPTVGEVSRRIYGLRIKEYRAKISCPQLTRSRSMVCSERECEEMNKGEFTGVCILRELLNLWDKAGYDQSFRVSEGTLRSRLQKSYHKYQKIKNPRTLKETQKSGQSRAHYKQKTEDFIREANFAFPVYRSNILQLLEDDDNRDENTKKKDIDFLKKVFRGERAEFD